MKEINFESIAGPYIYISIEEKEISLIDIEGFNFVVNLEKVNIIIQKVGYFQNFLRIFGIVPELEYIVPNRNITAKNVEFIGGEAATLIKNSLRNLNISFESSSFINVKAFEVYAFSVDIRFLNCKFLMGNNNQWPVVTNAVAAFLLISFSNIAIQNSIFLGNYSINNQNHILFISEDSRNLFLNLNVKNISIREVKKMIYFFFKKNKKFILK